MLTGGMGVNRNPKTTSAKRPLHPVPSSRELAPFEKVSMRACNKDLVQRPTLDICRGVGIEATGAEELSVQPL